MLKKLIDSHIGDWNIFLIMFMKYKPNKYYERIHCENDGQPRNFSRVFGWMIYLNDIKDGGGTHFVHQNFTTKPCGWTHMHHGVNAPKEVKYILTWVHRQLNKENVCIPMGTSKELYDLNKVYFESIYQKEPIDEKMNAGLRAYLDKKKAGKTEDKEENGNGKNGKASKGSKPDFLDLDKDGNKTEPMKSAAKSKKSVKEGSSYGITKGSGTPSGAMVHLVKHQECKKVQWHMMGLIRQHLKQKIESWQRPKQRERG